MLSVEVKNQPQLNEEANEVKVTSEDGRTLLKSRKIRYYSRNGKKFAYFSDNVRTRGILRNAGIEYRG